MQLSFPAFQLASFKLLTAPLTPRTKVQSNCSQHPFTFLGICLSVSVSVCLRCIYVFMCMCACMYVSVSLSFLRVFRVHQVITSFGVVTAPSCGILIPDIWFCLTNFSKHDLCYWKFFVWEVGYVYVCVWQSSTTCVFRVHVITSFAAPLPDHHVVFWFLTCLFDKLLRTSVLLMEFVCFVSHLLMCV